MSVEQMRHRYLALARCAETHARVCTGDVSLWCYTRVDHDLTALSIALDNATAAEIVGRRTDGAALARREAIGWA